VAIFFRRPVADLPEAVHFVAETPKLGVEGILVAVFGAQVRKVDAAGMVGIFHDFPGRVHAASAQVDGFHDLGAGLAGPVDKFVQPEGVGLQCVLGPVGAAGHLGDGEVAVNGDPRPVHGVDPATSGRTLPCMADVNVVAAPMPGPVSERTKRLLILCAL
jgi:hypothetical protein